MQLTLENPDFRYFLRGVSAEGILVNERRLAGSFILSPMTLIEGWRPAGVSELLPEDLEPLLALEPTVVLLGTGREAGLPFGRGHGRLPDPRHRHRGHGQFGGGAHFQRAGHRGAESGCGVFAAGFLSCRGWFPTAEWLVSRSYMGGIG